MIKYCCDRCGKEINDFINAYRFSLISKKLDKRLIDDNMLCDDCVKYVFDCIDRKESGDEKKKR